MFELSLDKIDITKSKKQQKLIYKEHDWTDDLMIPLQILLFPTVWIFVSIRSQFEIIHKPELYNLHLIIHLIAFLLLTIGIYCLFKNIQSRKFQTIKTNLSDEKNRELVLLVSKALNIQIHTNNKKILRGLYVDSFPYDQIVSIIYTNNTILFNSRNVCIGYNGKMGRPPWGFKASIKLYQLFKNNIENQMNIENEILCKQKNE